MSNEKYDDADNMPIDDHMLGKTLPAKPKEDKPQGKQEVWPPKEAWPFEPRKHNEPKENNDESA